MFKSFSLVIAILSFLGLPMGWSTELKSQFGVESLGTEYRGLVMAISTDESNDKLASVRIKSADSSQVQGRETFHFCKRGSMSRLDEDLFRDSFEDLKQAMRRQQQVTVLYSSLFDRCILSISL
jgi:hypothetical protein